jgi:hypothetical protein
MGFYVQLSTLGLLSSVAGIKGLPFASLSNAYFRSSNVIYFSGLSTNWTHVMLYSVGNNTVAYIAGTKAAAAALTNLVQADLSNSTYFFGSLTYQTNA